MRRSRGETMGSWGMHCRISGMISGDGALMVIGAGMGVDRWVSLGVVGLGGSDEGSVGFGRFWSCGGGLVGLCGGVTCDSWAGSWCVGSFGGRRVRQDGQSGWRSGAIGRGLSEASNSQSGRRERKSALELKREARYLMWYL